jgi:glycosyltransferase involved in cell wall biosynthesis
VVRAEAELLRRAGHEVIEYIVANPATRLDSAATLVQAPWNVGERRRLRIVAERESPDVVHVHNTWYRLSPAIFSALNELGLPVIVTLHNYRLLCVNAMLFRDGGPCELCVGSHPWHGVRHRCYRGSRSQSAAVASTISLHRWLGTLDRCVRFFLVLNDFARERLVQAGLPTDRVITKPNFVPNPGPRRIPPSEATSLLYVGRLSDEKGVQTALEAWARSNSDSGCILEVIGDGPLMHRLRTAGFPNVRFTGQMPVQQVRQRMLESRALLFPSRVYEAQSMTVLEALSAGLPVLASDRGAHGGLIRQFGPEWVVPPDDGETWSTSIGRVLKQENGAALDRFSASARRVHSEQFSEHTALQNLLGVYETGMASRS